MKFNKTKLQSGFSLVEILVVIALTVTIFVAVFTALQYSLQLIANSQARMSAMSLATNRIEFLRSLSYYDVGTVGGPVFGSIPNTSLLTLNGITFTENVRVHFVLDPADDAGGDPIINDYKKVEVEIEWTIHGVTDSVVFTSNIVPVSVESAEGYGAVKVEVRDESTGLPMPGATVRITNDTTFPTTDFEVITGASGVALVAVLAGSDYHASATAPGYSADMTYRVTGANPNPSPNSFLVLEALIADRPFRIGELSDIGMAVYSDITDVAVTESFIDSSGIAVNTDVAVNVVNETLELAGAPGSYVASGNAQLLRILPASLERWETAVIVGDAPVGTQYSVQFYTGDCAVSCVLVNDTDLPGNSSGLTDRFIDLSNLDVNGYPDITVQINLQGDTVETPSVDDVAIYYRSTETPRVGTDLDIHGDKIIGTPDVYKASTTVTTDVSGEVAMTDIEFDQYTIASPLTPTRVCGDVTVDEAVLDVNFTHQPGVNTGLELVLEATPSHTLRSIVYTDTGLPLPGATVLLERSGFSESVTTDSCGQAFIANTDGAEADYTVTVSRAGYADVVNNDFSIDGDTRLRVIVNES